LLPLQLQISSLEAYVQFQTETTDYINDMIVSILQMKKYELDSLLVEDISGPHRLQVIHFKLLFSK